MSTTDPTTHPTAHGPEAVGLPFRLYRDGDPAYSELARPRNLALQRRPVAIATPRSPFEVSAAARWASDRGLPIAVESTGHGVGGSHDGALLICTSGLTDCAVDHTGTVRVGAGVRWQAVLSAAAPTGFAPLCGAAPGVGVVGMTTGGGLGPAARTLGWTSDSVQAIDLVTADGVWQRVTASSEPDLFWAVRGGKGAVGIVTAVELRAPHITTLLAGALYYATADVERVVRAWAAWSGNLPREATTSLAVLQLPDAPGVPAPLAGRPTVAVRFVWVGDPAEGRRCLAPMRALAEPVLDSVAVRPWAELGAVHADPAEPMPTYEDHALLTGLDETAVDELLEHVLPEGGSPQLMVELRRLGGAVADEPEVSSAVCHRDAAYSLFTVGIDTPSTADAVRAHAAALVSALSPWAHEGTLANFAPYADPTRLARAYDPPTRSRLLALADRYDPARTLVAHSDLRESASELARVG